MKLVLVKHSGTFTGASRSKIPWVVSEQFGGRNSVGWSGKDTNVTVDGIGYSTAGWVLGEAEYLKIQYCEDT